MKKLVQLAVLVIKIITGYFLFDSIYRLIRRVVNHNNATRLYFKETLHLDVRHIQRIRLLSQFFFSIFAISLLAYISLKNFAPFGIKLTYAMSNYDDVKKKEITELTPKERVIKIQLNNESVYKQIDDLVYFNTLMPFHFDQATVKVTYKNPYPDQQINLGFRDKKDEWHYDMYLLDSPLLNSLSWQYMRDGVTLYQRHKKFDTVSDFFKSPPKDGIIGTYNYDISSQSIFKPYIPNYKPLIGTSVIDTPLRGRHTMYAFLSNEPFYMKVTKQDLNWYEGEDPLDVRIFKDGVQVFESEIPDDGIIDSSKRATDPQVQEMRNPGPGLPEAGVYKIIFDAGTDTVIKRIETNLHKMVFQGPVYPVNNTNLYPTITATTSATQLLTNAMVISAETFHPSSTQTISVDNKLFRVSLPFIKTDITPTSTLTQILLPKSDMVMTGLLGYFAFSSDQFFNPTPYYVTPISKEEDLNLADYVLADYIPPDTGEGWSVATRMFDITTGVIDSEKLSWLLYIPGLKKNNRSILIKDIEVTLSKKAMVDPKTLKLNK